MARYQIRLVEQSILEGSGDFAVEADTPERAATLLLQAHNAAREDCRDLAVLPDGQDRRIEPREVVDNRVFCVRLDEAGSEVGGEIEPDFGPPPTGTNGQGDAALSGAEPRP